MLADTVAGMGDTHAARAEELAAEAHEALRKAIKNAAAAPAALAVAGIQREQMWEEVRALQAQAQVHATLAHADATLALAEVVARGGTASQIA